MFVRGVRVDDEQDDERLGYPWSVPAIRAFTSLEFTRPVTFLMGENGSGKSTFLEALAIAAKATAVGAKDLGSDATLAGASRFANALTILSKAPKRSATRLFFRSEDAFGFTRRVEGGARELRELATELADDTKASESARKRAAGYIEGQRRALTARYGENVHARSHGETFLEIL